MQNEAFWNEWAEIGRDLLAYGRDIQFGQSLVEVKFMHGNPAVIIRSKSIKKKYPDNLEAKTSVNNIMKQSEDVKFDGARTFTLAYRAGKITTVILDEYSNSLVK